MNKFILVILFLISFIKADELIGIYIDQDTGLMWQDNSNVIEHESDWGNAQAYCHDLQLGGYQDWRLPEINELQTIINYSNNKSFRKNKIKFTLDPTGNNSYIWSNTSSQYIKGYAYYLFGTQTYYGSKSSKSHVRCVRLKNLTKKAKFIKDKKYPIIEDINNKLKWQDNSDVGKIKLNWIKAIDYCYSLNLGSNLSWRLPTIKELHTLINYSDYHTGLNSIFQYNTEGTYWSSTEEKILHPLKSIALFELSLGEKYNKNNELHKLIKIIIPKKGIDGNEFAKNINYIRCVSSY